MKISRIEIEGLDSDCINRIHFDNGNYIAIGHERDCCEKNFADLSQLDDEAFSFDFPENLFFENVDDSGFRFGDLLVIVVHAFIDSL